MEINRISGLIEPDSDVELLIINKINEIINLINSLNSTVSKMSEEIKKIKDSTQELEKSFHSDSHY